MKGSKIALIVLICISFSSVKVSASSFIGFGDSNTAGTYFKEYGYNMNQRWIVLTNAVNAGVSGNQTKQAMNRFQSDVLAKKPSSVSIMFGQNDGLLLDKDNPQVDKQTFEKNITYFVKQLKARKCKVLLMTSLPVNQTLYYKKYPEKQQLYANKGGIRLWLNSYNEIVRKVAKKERVTLVDHYANAVAKAGGAYDSALSKSGLIAQDGFHWTEKGHRMMAYSINHYLK